MKIKIIISVFFLLVLTAGLIGCKKDDQEPSKTEILCRDWRVVSINDDTNIKNYYGSDGFELRFEKDGDYKQSFVYSSYFNDYWGTWSWDNTESAIQTDVSSYGKKELKLEKLTNSEFWYTSSSGNLIKCIPK